MSHALSKIKAAGFTLELDGNDLVIEPFSMLSESQLAFLKTHKAEIIAELEAKQIANNLIVTCYTPAGNPIEVQARSADHAAWLLRVNSKPINYRGADVVEPVQSLPEGTQP